MSEVEDLRARVLAFAAALPVEQLFEVGNQISAMLGEFAQIRATSEHPALDEVASLMANLCGDAMDTAEQSLLAARERLEVYGQLL